jgi:L-alanine-DL-glutamate epimerase-like enolase superfamily enzyme
LRRILLLEVDADGATGWGECTAGEDPYYSYETVETAWHIIRDFLWPIVKYKEFDSAVEIFDLLARVRGHNMAKAGLETAIWDAEAKQKNLPLARGHARRDFLRRFHRHPARHRNSARQSGKRTGRRIPTHKNKNQAGQ